jgi:hypothetical protein
MTDDRAVPGEGHRRLEPPEARYTAEGIYGVIISAAVLASWHGERLIKLALSALVTLFIYWVAERYARVIATRIAHGRRPTWAELRRELSEGWEIVSTSFIPLAVLLGASALGAQKSNAVIAALIASTVLLSLAGWEMGRHGRLTAVERVVATLVAGAFGAAMIVLKTSLH